MADVPGPAAFRDPAFAARIRAGDRAALEAVVRAYLPQVLRAALGAGLSRERAEDATQETFKTFLETCHRFEGRSHVRTWLFGILYHKLSETRRAAQREERTDDIDEVMEHRFDARGMWARPPAADQALSDAQIRRYLEQCLEPLSERQRLAFVLREVEGLDSEEICNVLDVSRTNLGVLLFRARNKLRECLERLNVRG